MKINQLQSGNYNIRLRINGVIKSFTAPSKTEVKRMVEEYKYAVKREKEVGITLRQAIDRYIDGKRNILSPTTISLYETIRGKNCQNIMSIPVSKLTNQIIQEELNREAATHKPKTVANMRGLLSAALKVQGVAINVSVPQNPKKIIELPEVEDVMRAIKGKDIELPALLAMWLSCSASEIRGIQVSSIRDGYVTIQESMVDVDGVPVSKQATKEASARASLPHMTFHQLRHMSASIMAMLGINDIYAMQRGGWKTRSVMQNVYQHTFDSQRRIVDDTIDAYMDGVYQSVT